jgi:hypothetical protein
MQSHIHAMLQEILWDPPSGRDLAACTAATHAVWDKITYAADDPLLSPPTARHTNHPFLAMLPRRRNAPDDVQRILCMLVANVNSGNLTAVARDWSYLPPAAHRLGIEALLQTALFAGFPKCLNALATVYQTGVCRDAIDWAAEDDTAVINRATDPRMFFNRGLGLLREIYTKTTDGLRNNLREGHPDLELIIVEFMYVLAAPFSAHAPCIL